MSAGIPETKNSRLIHTVLRAEPCVVTRRCEPALADSSKIALSNKRTATGVVDIISLAFSS
jgi:hypothetical protein